MRKLILTALCSVAIAGGGPHAHAADGIGCDGFLWPLTTELSWMKAADSEQVASGATIAKVPADKAIALALSPVPEVKFPHQPMSTPKPEDAKAYGGFVTFESAEGGHMQVSLSTYGWIDVIQNGTPLESTGHSGSEGCDAIRKSVRFEIAPGPFSIQVSGVKANTIKFAIRPAAD